MTVALAYPHIENGPSYECCIVVLADHICATLLHRFQSLLCDDHQDWCDYPHDFDRKHQKCCDAMDFTVEFYETEAGMCPVREFLDELRKSDPDDFATVLAGLAKLRNRQYHRPPLSKSLGEGLFELRHPHRRRRNPVRPPTYRRAVLTTGC
jgi:hypothetical protein